MIRWYLPSPLHSFSSDFVSRRFTIIGPILPLAAVSILCTTIVDCNIRPIHDTLIHVMNTYILCPPRHDGTLQGLLYPDSHALLHAPVQNRRVGRHLQEIPRPCLQVLVPERRVQ